MHFPVIPTVLEGPLAHCSGEIDTYEAATSALFRKLAQDCLGHKQLTAVQPQEVALREEA